MWSFILNIDEVHLNKHEVHLNVVSLMQSLLKLRTTQNTEVLSFTLFISLCILK